MATRSNWKSDRDLVGTLPDDSQAQTREHHDPSAEKSSRSQVQDSDSAGARLPIVWRNSNPPVASAERTVRVGKASGHRGRRIINREQGCALEMIGHAVDYLNDQYLFEGPDDEILSFDSPEIEAVRILIASQREILRSLPVAAPFRRRAWNLLLHRKDGTESISVVPLSSSGK